MEQKGIRTERGNINRAIEKYNAMIMKIYGFISELKEELKKGVFRFVFERKNRTERDDIQSINPSINPSVPEQKSEVQTALENCRAELSELSVRYEKWTQAVSDYDDYKQYQPVMRESRTYGSVRGLHCEV